VTPKEAAKQVVDSLPNDVTMDDIVRALCVNPELASERRGVRGKHNGACCREHEMRVTRKKGTVRDRLARLGGKEGQARIPRRRRTQK
jgi:hypothetical protein